MNTLGDVRVRMEHSLAELEHIEFVSFDTETTGLSPVSARLVELSGVKFKLGQAECETFSSLINPRCSIPFEATRVHGITDAMVADAPALDVVIPDFFSWIGSKTVLVAHNAPFDLGFLRVAANILRTTNPTNPVIDTLRISRQLLQDSPNHQLGTLVKHLQLPDGGYHRALADSHHVRNLFAKLVDNHALKHWTDIEQLCSILRFSQDEEFFQDTPEEVQKLMDLINSAISDNTAVSFAYNGFKSRPRRVKPQAVIENRGNFYLSAFCYHFEAERTFRLDKISGLKLARVAAR